MDAEKGDAHESTEKAPLLDRSETEALESIEARAKFLANPHAGNYKGSKRGPYKISPEQREKSAARMKATLARLQALKGEAELRKKIAVAKQELAWRKKHESIRYYAVKSDHTTLGPHRKQDIFHRAKVQIRVASGGNRSGKSTAGINEDVAYALGYRPWLKPDDPDYKVDVRVPNKGLICGESFQEQVKKVILPKLLGDPEKGVPGAIPTNLLADVKRNPQGVITYIRLTNGSEIFLQSYDQDVDLFESADYDWVHFDEPPPRSIWVAVQRGLTDRMAPAWLTMTPLKEPWLYDEVYKREDCKVSISTSRTI
jgi:phage terminase large subunit-like protein